MIRLLKDRNSALFSIGHMYFLPLVEQETYPKLGCLELSILCITYIIISVCYQQNAAVSLGLTSCCREIRHRRYT